MTLKLLSRKIAVLFLLSLLVLLCCPSVSSASEATYSITETELTALENNLTQLATICEKQKQELTALKQSLVESRAALIQAKEQLTALKVELTALKETTTKQESLLQTANESLKQYAAEVKAERRKLKIQRSLSILAAIAALILAAT